MGKEMQIMENTTYDETLAIEARGFLADMNPASTAQFNELDKIERYNLYADHTKLKQAHFRWKIDIKLDEIKEMLKGEID